METSIKALIDFHSTRLLSEQEASARADEESEKLKFISK